MNCENRIKKWWSRGFKVRCGGVLAEDRRDPPWPPASWVCTRCGQLSILPPDHTNCRCVVNPIDTPTYKRWASDPPRLLREEEAHQYVQRVLPSVCYFYEAVRGVFSVYADGRLRAEERYPLVVTKPGATIDAAWRQAALLLGWEDRSAQTK